MGSSYIIYITWVRGFGILFAMYFTFLAVDTNLNRVKLKIAPKVYVLEKILNMTKGR